MAAAPPRNLNMVDGSPGSLPFFEVAASRAITVGDLGKSLRVDPGGGTVTLTLGTSPSTGFFCEIVQVGAGTVNFIAGAGATVNSTAGATPTLSAQFAGVTATRHPGTQWIVGGSIV